MDNVQINAGSGPIVATDEVALAHFQRVKLDLGPENTSVPLVADNAASAGNPIPIGGVFNSVAPIYDDGDRVTAQFDGSGNLKMVLATGIAGESWTVNRLFIEHNYSYSRKTADGQVLGAAGFIHTVTISPLTASPTAGLLTIYDSLSETGTAVYTEWIFADAPGHTVTLDYNCGTGIYVGYDGTLANVSVSVSYRSNT